MVLDVAAGGDATPARGAESRQPPDRQTLHCLTLHRIRRRTSINGMAKDARSYCWRPSRIARGRSKANARDRLTITPRTPPRGSTATETFSSCASVSRCSAEGRCRSCCASRWCRPSHERGALPWPSWPSGGPWSERRPCRRCSSRASGLRPCWLTLTRRTRATSLTQDLSSSAMSLAGAWMRGQRLADMLQCPTGDRAICQIQSRGPRVGRSRISSLARSLPRGACGACSRRA